MRGQISEDGVCCADAKEDSDSPLAEDMRVVNSIAMFFSSYFGFPLIVYSPNTQACNALCLKAGQHFDILPYAMWCSR